MSQGIMNPGSRISISDIDEGGAMDRIKYDLIRNWMYRNARPLDLARWRFHFEEGPAEEVLGMLYFYQNADGGFGNALEADSWNPHSTPITTNTAVEILREIGHKDRKHPMIRNMLKYLESEHGKISRKWLFSMPENNLYPHAPWWEAEGEGALTKFNPTASLIRFILDHGDYDSDLYMMALNELERIKEEFMKEDEPTMHDLMSLETIRAYLDEERLFELEEKTLEKNPLAWVDYTCKPSAFIKDESHPLYRKYKDLMHKELDFLEESLDEEGYFDINWKWSDYEEEFAISRNWWRADLNIRYLLLLRNFGKV